MDLIIKYFCESLQQFSSILNLVSVCLRPLLGLSKSKLLNTQTNSDSDIQMEPEKVEYLLKRNALVISLIKEKIVGSNIIL